MDIKELQQWVAEDWRERSRHFPSPDQQLLLLVEEVGELAEAIRKQDGRKARKITASDIGSEIADVVISVLTVANTHNIDVSAEIERFKSRLRQRQEAGF